MMTTRGRIGAVLGTAAMAVSLTMVASVAPAGASRQVRSAGTGRAGIPATPRLPVALHQGVNAQAGMPAAARMAVVDDVAWLQGRLDIILPRIKYTKGLVPIDGVFGPSTAAGVTFFKTWGNQAHAALHLAPLFAKTDDSVGPTSEAIIALVGAYFQNHPNGASTTPETPSQVTEMLLLNHDRARLGLPPFTVNFQIQHFAQSWAGSVASAGAISLQDLDTLRTDITTCTNSGDNSVAQDVASGPDLVSLESLLLTSHDPDNAGTINIQDKELTTVGVGVVGVPGGVYLVIDFTGNCASGS